MIKEKDCNDAIDKIYLFTRDLSEPNYQFLIKKREDAGIKNINNPNSYIVCSNTKDDVYKDVDNYNSKRDKKVLIVFDDIIADIMGYGKISGCNERIFY